MISIQRDVPLAPYTTFGVGGPARYFVRVTCVKDCIEALNFCEDNRLPFFILGGGSNILVSDDGFDGCVIKNEIGTQSFEVSMRPSDADVVLVRCWAGKPWDDFVQFCVQKKWAGLEALSGIPGTVGAAPVQNIGAYGVSAGDFIEHVEALDIQTKKEILLTREQCVFSYRLSIFKKNPNRFIITAVVFKLAHRSRVAVPQYHDISARLFFASFGVSLHALRKAILAIRAQKGMVQGCQKSAGSFFKNPVVSQKEFDSISQKIDMEKKQAHWPWYWQLSEDRVKISAAFLMEQAGFKKGYRVGRVGLSPYHALAIIHDGGATAQDIMSFAHDIQEKVFQIYSVFLETEVQYVGFPSNPSVE